MPLHIFFRRAAHPWLGVAFQMKEKRAVVFHGRLQKLPAFRLFTTN